MPAQVVQAGGMFNNGLESGGDMYCGKGVVSAGFAQWVKRILPFQCEMAGASPQIIIHPAKE